MKDIFLVRVKLKKISFDKENIGNVDEEFELLRFYSSKSLKKAINEIKRLISEISEVES